jgi:hypothetical protein
MPTLVLRAILTAALLLSIGGVVLAQSEPAPATAEDPRLLPYLEPGQLVDIGGRRINLYCTGSGAPTVVLMAGISSWSPVWYKTQPGLLEVVTERHARRVQKDLASVLHRRLCSRQSPADLVAVHTPVRQRRPPSPWRNAARRAVGRTRIRGQHARWQTILAGIQEVVVRTT